MRFVYLDSSLQEVIVVSFGLIVMLIVWVGIVEYVHALSPSPVMVGKLPLVMPPPALALEQWQKADGSAFGLPSKPSPLVLRKHWGGMTSGSPASSSFRIFCCSSDQSLSKYPLVIFLVHLTQGQFFFSP